MTNLLLLYDTKETDLARDVQDLLNEINIGSLLMIPLEPDKGLSLEDKERVNFNTADGAIFLITPGSERLGQSFPSPSVSHEMGQAKQKFQKKPENVVYLVDKNCNLPAIDQKTYTRFDRNDIRSVLQAFTLVFRNLKTAGIFRTNPIPTQMTSPKAVDMKTFARSLEPEVKNLLLIISNKTNGWIDDQELRKILVLNHSKTNQTINLLLLDLEKSRTATRYITSAPQYYNGWMITDLGWELVRYELKIKNELQSQSTRYTLEALVALAKNSNK